LYQQDYVFVVVWISTTTTSGFARESSVSAAKHYLASYFSLTQGFSTIHLEIVIHPSLFLVHPPVREKIFFLDSHGTDIRTANFKLIAAFNHNTVEP